MKNINKTAKKYLQTALSVGMATTLFAGSASAMSILDAYASPNQNSNPANFYNFQYQGRNIPTCDANVDTDYQGNKSIEVKKFQSKQADSSLICNAQVFTLYNVTGKAFIETFLKNIASKQTIVDRHQKGNKLVFVSKSKQDSRIVLFHGLVVDSSDRIIYFNSFSPNKDTAQKALIHMLKNYR